MNDFLEEAVLMMKYDWCQLGKLYPLEEIRQKTVANTLTSGENTVMSPMEQTERATMY